MPELPEVETIMLGITPFLEGATITKVKLNRSDLRWPYPENFAKCVEKAKVLNLKRCSKWSLVEMLLEFLKLNIFSNPCYLQT